MTDPTASPGFSIVIGDASSHVRDALTAMISDHAELHLAGTASTGDDLTLLCAKEKPHVAVFDLMTCSVADRIDEALRAASPKTVQAVFTARANRRGHSRLLDSGVHAVFDKGAVDHLADALHALAVSVLRAPRVEPKA